MRLLARSLSSVAGLDKAIAPFLAPAIVGRRHHSSQPATAREEQPAGPSSSGSFTAPSTSAWPSPTPPSLGRWVDAFARTVRDASADGSTELPPAVRAELLRIHPRCPEELRELLDGSRPSSSARPIDDDALAAYISTEIKGRAGRLRLNYKNAAPSALDALAALAHVCASQRATRSLDVITQEVMRWIRERRELEIAAETAADSAPRSYRPALASYAPVAAALRSRLQLGPSAVISATLLDFSARRAESVQATVAQRRLTPASILAARVDELEPLWERVAAGKRSEAMSNSLLAAMIQRLADLPDEERALTLAEGAIQGALQAWATTADKGRDSASSTPRHPPVAPLRALIELRLTLLERALAPGATTGALARSHFRASRPGRRQRQEAKDVVRAQLSRVHHDTDLLAQLESEALVGLHGEASAAAARVASIRNRSLAHAAVLGMRVFSLARREDLMIIEAERLSGLAATPSLMPKLSEAMRIVTNHVGRSDRAAEVPALLVWSARTLDLAHRSSLLRLGSSTGVEDARRASVQLTSAIKHTLRASLDRSDEAVDILMRLAHHASARLAIPNLFDNKATVDGAFRWAMRRREGGVEALASSEEADRETLRRLELLLAVLSASKSKPRVRGWVDGALEAMGVSLENRGRWAEALRSSAVAKTDEAVVAASADRVEAADDPAAPVLAERLNAAPDKGEVGGCVAFSTDNTPAEEPVRPPAQESTSTTSSSPPRSAPRSSPPDDVSSAPAYVPPLAPHWSMRSSGLEIWDPPYPAAQRQTASSSTRSREERSLAVRFE